MPDNSNKNQTASKNEPKDQRKPRQGKSKATLKANEKKAELAIKAETDKKYDIVTRSSTKVKSEPMLKEEVSGNDDTLNISEDSDGKYKKKEITSNWAKYDAPIETYEEYEELEDMGPDYEVYDKKKRRKKRIYFNYTEESMIAAVKDARSGIPVSTVAKMHNVPKTSLLNKVSGLRPISRKMGREAYLNKEQEQRLAEWVKSATAAGFRITKQQILDAAKQIILELNIDNPFKEGRPGKRWFCCFLVRNRGIGPLIGLVPMVSSITTEPDMRLLKWYKRISNYISDNNHEEIFQNPNRVFNAIEILVFLKPKKNRLLIPRWQKLSKEDEFVSMFLTGNAAGDLLPPMLTFKYIRNEPETNTISLPFNWTAHLSETGCISEEILYDYICNTFSTYLQENNIETPVILFIDSRYEAMLTYKLCTFCSENGIILIGLQSKDTHMIQPLEVSVVNFLKSSWVDILYEITRNSSVNITKYDFASHFEPAVETVTSESVVKGFSKCGVVPWNPGRVLKKISLEFTELQEKVPELEAGIQFIEKYVHEEKIKLFKSIQDASNIKQEDKSLFMFYKHVNDMRSDAQFMSDVCLPLHNDTNAGTSESDESNEEDDDVFKKLPMKRSTPALKQNVAKKMKMSPSGLTLRQLQNKFNKRESEELKAEYLEEYSDSDDEILEMSNAQEDLDDLVIVVKEENADTFERDEDQVICQVCKFTIKSGEEKNKCMMCQGWSCFICCDGYDGLDYLCYKCLGPQT